MTQSRRPTRRFPDAREDIRHFEDVPDTPQTASPAYRLAFSDPDFMTRDDLRPVRLQLELLKPELNLTERGIVSTIAMLGSARIPAAEDAPDHTHKGLAALSSYYEEAREFARIASTHALTSNNTENVICTGGGPGIMEAGNRGAEEAGGVSISLNIVLPHEQAPNPYCTPDLCFNFHYFAVRKMHFLMRAKAIVVFPGGFGTFDEFFEAITLVQTRRMKPLPMLLFGREFWENVVNFDALVEAGTISPGDIDLFQYVETAQEAWDAIENWTPQE